MLAPSARLALGIWMRLPPLRTNAFPWIVFHAPGYAVFWHMGVAPRQGGCTLQARARILVVENGTRICGYGKRSANPPLRVSADQGNAVFFQFHGKSSWSRLLGQVGSFSSTSQR